MQPAAPAGPQQCQSVRDSFTTALRRVGVAVLASGSSVIKFNRQTDGRFVKVRPIVGLSVTGLRWRHTREKPMVNEMELLDRDRRPAASASAWP
jgi:hypothetical protein